MNTPKTFTLLTALMLIFAFSCFPAASIAAGRITEPYSGREEDTMLIGTVSVNKTDVCSNPTSDSEFLGIAEKGGRYAVLGTYGEWYGILFNGTEGYLRRSCMEVNSEDVSQNADVTLKVATFNVQALNFGKTASQAVGFLKETGADIAGVQEVDRCTLRSGKTDWAAEFAKLTGYRYYFFAPAMEYDGGYYGTLILSRYPIIETETIRLDTAEGAEPRALAFARVLTPGGAVSMFNTHLSFESEEAIAVCAASFSDKLFAEGQKRYFVTGDFNTTPDVLSLYTEGLTAANTEYPTFEGTESVIDDNILYTKGITAAELSVKDAITPGISDHNLVLVTLTIHKYYEKLYLDYIINMVRLIHNIYSIVQMKG